MTKMMPGRRLPHPNQEALNLLYYLYYMVAKDRGLHEFDPMGYIEEHERHLFEFMTDLFHKVATAEMMDREDDGFWLEVIPYAVDELS